MSGRDFMEFIYFQTSELANHAKNLEFKPNFFYINYIKYVESAKKN